MASAVPFCHVVLAHRHVDQVARLAAAIRARDPQADVVVAFNGDLSEAEASALATAAVRRVGSGRPASWGGFNLVERTLEALDAVPAGSWAVLVSGDSHPTGDLAAWQESVVASGADCVLDGAPVAGDPMLEARIRYRWRIWLRPSNRVALFAFRAVSAVAGRLGPRPRLRSMPQGLAVGVRRRTTMPDPYVKGSQWFAIGPVARERLLALSRRADVRDRFADSLIPDEAFVHTLAATEGWAVLDQPVMHVEWPYDGSPHPRALGPADLVAVRASGAPFARKLEGPEGRELADLLDGDGAAAPG